MGQWILLGGKIWQDQQLKNNKRFVMDVHNEEDRKMYLNDDDVITPGLYDIHCHLWGQKDTFGKGSFISLSPEHLLSTGIVGCADAGSYGYHDWLEANRIWGSSNLQIKSWLNIMPEGLTVSDASFTKPEDVDKALLVELFQKYRSNLLGFKLIHGLTGGDQKKERSWLRLTHEVAEQAKAPLMIHLTGSSLDIRETLDIMREGDIISHAYNYGGPGGIILDEQGEVMPEVMEAHRRGVLIDMASAFRHFSFQVYQKAHELGLEPDFIATDNNIRDYRKQPMVDIVHLLSKMIAAGMDQEQALKAAIDTPRAYMGFSEDYTKNMVVLKCVQGPVQYQDTILKEPKPIFINADWTYQAQYGVYHNHCIFFRA